MKALENVDQWKILRFSRTSCMQLANNNNGCMLQTVQGVMGKSDPGTEWDVPLYVLCWKLACQLFCVE
jgi:hypothetical protein